MVSFAWGFTVTMVLLLCFLVLGFVFFSKATPAFDVVLGLFS